MFKGNLRGVGIGGVQVSFSMDYLILLRKGCGSVTLQDLNQLQGIGRTMKKWFG